MVRKPACTRFKRQGGMALQNPYLPYPVRIDEIINETEDKDLKTFKLVFLSPEDQERFDYRSGQFAELSVTGKGEIPIGIASSPTEKGYLKFTINKVGLVSSFLHAMKAGDIMGVRGPLGNSFPWEEIAGKNVVLIGGGFAFTSLRSSIVYMLDPVNRPKFKDIHVVYGARSPGMLLYRDELAAWEQRDDINVHITVDATDDPDWEYNTGFVPTITEQKAPPGNAETYAIVCGPPVMIKFTQPVLDNLGYDADHIVISFENRMKCGIGMCGRCNIGKEFVCKDGPVFTLAQLDRMPKEY